MMKLYLKFILVFLAGVCLAYSVFVTFRLISVSDGFLFAKAVAEENSTVGAHEALIGDTSDYIAAAETVQEAFRRVSAETLESVVQIRVVGNQTNSDTLNNEIPWDDFFLNPDPDSNNSPPFFRNQGLGSGVIVEKDGNNHYVLTSAHVVSSSREIELELNDGTNLPAELVGTDNRKDLALVSFELADSGITPLKLGDSDSLYVGDWVMAFGSPFGYRQSASYGIVSALGRREGPGNNISDFIQTDAAINQGSSGGALVNIRGELVGINTFITTPNSGSIGLGFAVPINNARTVIRQLIDDKKISYGWLGVSLGPIGAESSESLGYPLNMGSMVYQVFTESPAGQYGILPGDLILGFDGKKYTSTEELIYSIGEIKPGNTVEFEINRFDQIIIQPVKIGERQDEQSVSNMHGEAFPGFVAAPLTDDVLNAMNLPPETTGIPVAQVYPRTAAQSAGLRVGDIIIALDDYPTPELRDLYQVMAERDYSLGRLTIIRDGEQIEINGDEEFRL